MKYPIRPALFFPLILAGLIAAAAIIAAGTRITRTQTRADALRTLDMVHGGISASAEVTDIDFDVLISTLPSAERTTATVRMPGSSPRDFGPYPRVEKNPDDMRFTATRPLSDGRLLQTSTWPAKNDYLLWLLALIAAAALILLPLWRIRHLNLQLKRYSQSLAPALDQLPDRSDYPFPDPPFAELQEFAAAIASLPQAHDQNLKTQMRFIDAGRNARERKANVFASVSHDLKGPLNSILGFTELLAKGMDGPLVSAQQKTVARIAEESERLLMKIGEVLDSARLDAGRLELDMQWVPSVEILTDCEAGARRLIGSRPIGLTCRMEPGLPPVLVDRDRISRALLSLISVSVDFMETGELKLNAYRLKSGDSLRAMLAVDIIDTGCRIDEIERHRLIGIFKATEGVFEKREAGAVGLGLVLSRRVVRLHGGEVSAQSGETQSGLGCVFSVTLPLADLKRVSGRERTEVLQ